MSDDKVTVEEVWDIVHRNEERHRDERDQAREFRMLIRRIRPEMAPSYQNADLAEIDRVLAETADDDLSPSCRSYRGRVVNAEGKCGYCGAGPDDPCHSA